MPTGLRTRKTSRISRRLLRAWRPTLLALAVAGLLCSFAFWPLWQDRATVIARAESSGRLPLGEFLQADLGPGGSVKLDVATLAALAANVYANTDDVDADCVADDGGRIALPGWERLHGWSEPAPCGRDNSGLTYQVWGRYSDEGVMFVAVVFRGTSSLKDWCSNLRDLEIASCEPIADQYLYVASLIDSILDGVYDEWGPDRYVFAIGHSLGGGLAELAGYTSYIDRVYTFDSSPVTGDDIAAYFRDGDQGTSGIREYTERLAGATDCPYWGNNLAAVSPPTVVRIYEHGEALVLPRFLRRLVMKSTSEPSSVSEYRTNVLRGGMLRQHGMKLLACELRARSPGPS